MSRAALPAWCNADSIDTVLVAFVDVYGRLLGKRITYKHFAEAVVGGGTHVCDYLLTVDIDMTPLPGFALASWDQGYGDLHLVPDLETLRPWPWQAGSAIVIADAHHPDHRPVEESPRRMLQRQLQLLAERGLSAQMASELEFYLFEQAPREAFASGYRDLRASSDYLIDYHLLHTARDEPVMRRLRNEMARAGIAVEGSKGEWGKGQYEINLLHQDALTMADSHVLFKHAAKEVAAQEGHSATFMAKWRTEEAGSSCHIHTSLWDRAGQQNRFSSEHGTSPLFRQFLGGLLAYGRDLSYFFAPTVNAYKRYQADSWAPTSLSWAYDNRTTGLRVVGQQASLRIENRMPGADVNPYLAFAATLAAGMRGIDDQLDCSEAYTGNAYADPQLPRLPASLLGGADLLDNSQIARDAFGDPVIDFYVHTARSEAQAYLREVTDWERTRYFEQI